MSATRITAIDGGVTAPQGFRAAGVGCGIKASGARDLTLIAADGPVSAAGRLHDQPRQAAPVILSRDHLAASGGRAAAIVVNSGCANACTGADGVTHAVAMADLTAKRLGCKAGDVLVASTGVIGVKLDMTKVERGIAMAADALSPTGGADAARGIMTTDPFPKEASVRDREPEGHVPRRRHRQGLGHDRADDGDDAGVRHDRCGGGAGGAAAGARGRRRTTRSTRSPSTASARRTTACSRWRAARAACRSTRPTLQLLVESLRAACEPLAIGIVRGGEGATKLITVHVTGAQSDADARRTARAIANSPLVKTAIHGGDPNWGRLVAVAGRAGVEFSLDRARRPDRRPVELFSDGGPHDELAPKAAEYLKGTRDRGRGRSRHRRHGARRGCGPAISAPSTCGSMRSTEPDDWYRVTGRSTVRRRVSECEGAGFHHGYTRADANRDDTLSVDSTT